MDRVTFEEPWAFTDYSWRGYERAIHPLGGAELVTPRGMDVDGQTPRYRPARSSCTSRCTSASTTGT
jgi:hypothetical protein